jgi:hypothetical protein
LGHAKPPSLILLELLVSHTLSPLTNAEVRLCLMYSFHGFLLCFFCEGLVKLRECVCVAVDCICLVQYFPPPGVYSASLHTFNIERYMHMKNLSLLTMIQNIICMSI